MRRPNASGGEAFFRNTKFFSTAVIALMFLLTARLPRSEAAFEGDAFLPRILICEVKPHRETLEPSFVAAVIGLSSRYYPLYLSGRAVESLEGKLGDAFQSAGVFQVAYRPPSKRIPLTVAEWYGRLHMACIIESGDYRKNLKREGYSDEMLDFADPYGKLRGKKSSKNSFLLPSAEMEGVRLLSESATADYLLFCNLQECSMEKTHKAPIPMTPVNSVRNKLRFTIDYYLVEARSGKVAHGRSELDETIAKSPAIY